jgi:hypothetical protein
MRARRRGREERLDRIGADLRVRELQRAEKRHELESEGGWVSECVVGERRHSKAQLLHFVGVRRTGDRLDE